jgi:membrane protease YdiL (CAAX protease family)
MAEDRRRIQEDRRLVQLELPTPGGGEDKPPDPAASWFVVRWSGGEIIAAAFVGLLWPSLLYEALRQWGFYAWFYGADFPALVDSTTATPADLLRLRLWAMCAALPLQVGSVLLLLRALSSTRPSEVGLTLRRLGANLLSGLLTAGVLVPVVYGIQAFVVVLYPRMQPHPFTDLGQQSLRPVEWVLLVLAATVVAGVWEELLFRGLVQPWAITRPYGGRIVLCVALLLSLVARSRGISSALDQPSLDALQEELLPALVLLALVPAYLYLEHRRPLAAGLFASAVLFAWVHANVWPSPIPLLVLALGLGWLAWRTQSLIGPILLHALFNGVACLILLWPLVRRALAG